MCKGDVSVARSVLVDTGDAEPESVLNSKFTLFDVFGMIESVREFSSKIIILLGFSYQLKENPEVFSLVNPSLD